MDRVLTILEVSRKQDYIFSSKKLRENADRSNEIAYVTGSEFFRESAKNLYDEQRNMVYAGGGHTVLQFDSADQAVAFTRAVTEDALRRFEGMEIFAKTLPYNLAEELCSSAKRYGSSIDKDGRVSAMDWHIEFGQLKENLSEIRKDYETEDGCRLELRPVTVIVPDGVNASPAGQRSYDFFRAMCSAMKNEYGNIARSKIKDLREALKQGEVESEFFLQDKKVQDLLYHGFTAMHRTDRERADIYREMFNNGGKLYKKAFADFDGMRRCLFFDAIEMIDHCDFLEVVE